MPRGTPGAVVAAPLLRTAEAASYLALSPNTLRNWRSYGEGPPALKLGGAIRYRVEDLDAWIASQAVAGD
jgi:excisionase family DNA binding protein